MSVVSLKNMKDQAKWKWRFKVVKVSILYIVSVIWNKKSNMQNSFKMLFFVLGLNDIINVIKKIKKDKHQILKLKNILSSFTPLSDSNAECNT